MLGHAFGIMRLSGSAITTDSISSLSKYPTDSALCQSISIISLTTWQMCREA